MQGGGQDVSINIGGCLYVSLSISVSIVTLVQFKLRCIQLSDMHDKNSKYSLGSKF